MHRWTTTSLALVLVIAASGGCSSDDGPTGQAPGPAPADVAGTWTFAPSPGDPPRTTSCLLDIVQFTACSFTIPIQQTEDMFNGSATTHSCLAAPGIGGTVSGTVLSGKMRMNTFSGSLDIDFRGVVNGDSIMISPTHLSFDGFDTPCFCGDSCGMDGTYNGTR
jgi:hypothetical protein